MLPSRPGVKAFWGGGAIAGPALSPEKVFAMGALTDKQTNSYSVKVDKKPSFQYYCLWGPFDEQARV